MANYYWLGVTGACGNVNNPANWTLWTPQGACGFLPPAALTGPGYGDSVYFTRFTVSGACYGVDYYPQVAPQGQMLGRTGTAAGQHFENLWFEDNCPVPLGAADHYFKFNARFVSLNLGADNTQMNNQTSYIDVGKNSSYALYASIGINAGRSHTYWIKGQARNVNTVIVSRPSYATVHLKDMEFAVPLETSISAFPVTNNYPSNDIFYLYPTTTGYNGFKLKGNAAFNIYSGYSQSQDTILYGESYAETTGNTCIVNFLASGYSGPSGSNELSRSYIQNLKLTGNSKLTNIVNVNHGVDFVNLQVNAGTVNFNQANDTNATVVQKGYMYGATSKITATNPTVAIGSNGDFTIMEPTFSSSYAPDITLKGNWIMDLNPGLAGACGPN